MLKYTKEFLEPLVKRNISISGILRELNKHANGGSHSHLSRLIKRFELDTSHFIYGGVVNHFKQIEIDKESLQKAVSNNLSMAGVLRELGFNDAPSGRWHREIYRLVEKYNISIIHFTGKAWNKGSKMPIGKGGKKDPREYLVLRDESERRVHGKVLKQALLEIGRPNLCEYCGQEPIWKDKILVLEVDHKNGKFWDNREENLAISCPNCHSQMPTFGIRNLYALVAQLA